MNRILKDEIIFQEMTNEQVIHNNSHFFLLLIEAMFGLCDVYGLMTILVKS